jgi:dihydropteroate synthase
LERLTITRSPAPPRGFADSGRFYLRPVGLLRGTAAAHAVDAGAALRLAGGPIAFSACELIVRMRDRAEASWMPVDGLASWRRGLSKSDNEAFATLIERLVAPRPPLAGASMDRTRIMGIVNVTPDSFSDGGQFAGTDQAIEHGIGLAQAGADIVDVGGESTRPGAEPVSEAAEQERVIPVVRKLVDKGVTVSVDTRNPATMRLAAAAGARMINDVTALSHTEYSVAVAAETGLPVILMHSAGDPRVMQDDPTYDHAALDVYDRLERRLEACAVVGIPRERIAADPGIGFGKTVAHNMRLIEWASLFHGLGCPVLIGASRKSTISRIAGPGAQDASARLPGSLTLAQAAWDQGVQLVRVHDVAETRQSLAVWRAIDGA